MQPTNVHSMGDVVESRMFGVSESTLSQIADDELSIMERNLLALVQMIRRARGKSPLETKKQMRKRGGYTPNNG